MSHVTATKAKQTFALEKGPRVQLQPVVDPIRLERVYKIPLQSECLTVNTLRTKALNQDKNFFTYDASNRNTCQSFVENVLHANNLIENILDEETLLALKPQDAAALISALGSYHEVFTMITDMACYLDKLIYDQKIVWASIKTLEDIMKWHGH
jgi:hypothetical protein